MKEVTLAYGLNLLLLGKVSRLYSDGLENTEYIYCDKGKFYYEDDALIGTTFFKTLNVLLKLEWPLRYKFFVTETYEDDKGRAYKYYEKELNEKGFYILYEKNHKYLGVKENQYCVVKNNKECIFGTELKVALNYFEE